MGTMSLANDSSDLTAPSNGHIYRRGRKGPKTVVMNARCLDCDWKSFRSGDRRTGMDNLTRYHRKTGHTVEVVVTKTYIYDPLP
jgi:hypothetical protein